MPRAALPRRDLDEVVDRAAGAFDRLRGARVLVTGATGFIGRWLVESLLRADTTLGLGVRVAVLVRDPSRAEAAVPHITADSRVEAVVGDVRDFRGPAWPPTHVVHAASAATPALNAADPDAVIEMIAGGTRHVVEASGAAGTERLLVVSSGSVYARGATDPPRLAEDHPTLEHGRSTPERFGAAKRAAERAALDSAVPAVAARLFTLLGPGLPIDGQFAVGQFLGDALRGRPVQVTGDGSPIRSYLHAADLATWCWTIAVHGAPGAAYNVGSETEITVSELAQRVAALAVPPVGVTIGSRRGAGGVDRYVPATDRARTELGLEAWTDIATSLHRTWEWLREDAR